MWVGESCIWMWPIANWVAGQSDSVVRCSRWMPNEQKAKVESCKFESTWDEKSGPSLPGNDESAAVDKHKKTRPRKNANFRCVVRRSDPVKRRRPTNRPNWGQNKRWNVCHGDDCAFHLLHHCVNDCQTGPGTACGTKISYSTHWPEGSRLVVTVKVCFHPSTTFKCGNHAWRPVDLDASLQPSTLMQRCRSFVRSIDRISRNNLSTVSQCKRSPSNFSVCSDRTGWCVLWFRLN